MTLRTFSRGQAAAAPARRLSRTLALPALAGIGLLLGGCVGIGIGVPLVPGLSIGVGYGAGGPSIGLGTGWGPVGAGIGFNGSGQVIGSAGVGVSAGAVGVGVGQSVVLSDPAAPTLAPATLPAPGAGGYTADGVPIEQGVVLGAEPR